MSLGYVTVLKWLRFVRKFQHNYREGLATTRELISWAAAVEHTFFWRQQAIKKGISLGRYKKAVARSCGFGKRHFYV